ncbi:unnamed protein product [Tilletia controversa]|uniref:ER transporter 6TM N-terminal domain-containing protein n=1 Tax=Tilletia controversa TaxID=13291 RepID=A0A8X7SYH3_9BASI|nr:hypothetical protein CF328_g4640 [Tilletia controversa]KAE8250953.1 hypothetical protein A4X06_0g2869 [Tilletia controversa]CAD6928474.1 unnamed protein product [Tilletia controversa]CAD6970593.1 unnamed protein product [Tilletia controversa]
MSDPTEQEPAKGTAGAAAHSSQTNDAKTQSKSKAKKTGSKLPTWITSNLRNKRSLQLWFRCWLAAWTAFILMLPNRSLTNLGQAAFFVCMVMLMLPPLMTPFLWLIAMSTLVIGALFGWAMGCAAMASALRARNVQITGAAILKAQQSAASATNPEAAFRSTIFEGRYLDTKSTVVFGAYLIAVTYFLGFITARAQKLKLFCIFATIVFDVHATYGPLFPSPNYTLATILILPMAYAVAIGAASIILIFPRSLNAEWSNELAGLIGQCGNLLKVHRAYLHKAATGHNLPDADADGATSEHDKDGGSQRLASFPELSQEFESQFRALTAGLVQGSESLAGSGPFLELEPSRGLFSGKDLRKILAHVQKAAVRIFGMNAFHHLLESEHPEPEDIAARQQAKDSTGQPGGADYEDKDKDIEADDAQPSHAVFHVHASLRLMHWKKQLRGAEAEQHVRLREDLLPILHRGAMPALTAAQEAMEALAEWLRVSNQGRWSFTAKQRKSGMERKIETLQALRDALDRFEAALDHFIDKERIALLSPYEGHFVTKEGEDGSHLLSQDTYKAFRHSARPVFLCLLFCANFSNYGHTSIDQIRYIIALSERRVFGLSEAQQVQLKADHGGKLEYGKLSPVGPKIWFPTGMRKIGKLLLSRRSGAAGVGPGSGAVFPSEVEDNGRDEAVPVAARRRTDSDIQLESGRSMAAHLHAPDAEAQHRAELEELDDEDDDDDDRAELDTIASSVLTAPTLRQEVSSGPGQHGADSTELKANGEEVGTQKQKKDEKKRAQRFYAPDPDALPPTNAMQRFSRVLSNAYDTACSPDGIFALRYSLVSFLVWIPAVVSSSAGFSYSNRLLWALIMAQTGLTTTSGEAVFQIAGRLAGTIVGALGGMVVWYIGAGSGRGNAFGIAAAMGVVLVPLTFFRAFVPLALLIPCMLSSVTLVLIVGYSWIDTHLAGLTSNSGWGKDVAWRRLLLVLIGVAAAIIVMLFPRPVSTRIQVRKGLAGVTRDIQRLYCLLIEAWIISDLPDGADSNNKESLKHVQERIDGKLVLFRTRFQMAQAKLAGLAPKIKLAAIDLQPRGRWDAKSYDDLLRTHARQLEALSQLAGSLHFMRPEWRHQFAMNTAVLNPEVVSDISLQLSLIAASLDKGAPLPHAGIGVLFERVLLAGIFSTRVQDKLSAQTQQTSSDGRTPFFAEVLSFETLQKPDYMNVVLGAMALTTLAKRTDELANIVAKLCGELQIRGFDRLRDQQARRSLKAFGLDTV